MVRGVESVRRGDCCSGETPDAEDRRALRRAMATCESPADLAHLKTLHELT